MAHKKGQGSVRNGRDGVSKRLGVKKFGSEARYRRKHYCSAAWNSFSSWQERGNRSRFHSLCSDRRRSILR